MTEGKKRGMRGQREVERERDMEMRGQRKVGERDRKAEGERQLDEGRRKIERERDRGWRKGERGVGWQKEEREREG